MAATYQTLSELIEINDKNANDLGATDLVRDAPVLAKLSATVASNGTNHKYLVENGAPTVGFRQVNSGRENSKSSDRLVEIALSILDASFDVDMKLADGYHKGRGAFLAREAGRHLRAAFYAFESQIFNGNDAEGFDGFAQALDELTDEFLVNATGSTANTGSSVYLIRTNDDGTDVQAVIGNDGNIQIEDTVTIQKATQDDSAPGTYPALYTPISGWCGLQVGSATSIVRICNLTAQTGKGLTDALIASALAKFPASRQPNLIAMNRRSQEQLRSSRTATNATGTPAPRPTDAFGIEIVTTDTILNTEAIVAS